MSKHLSQVLDWLRRQVWVYLSVQGCVSVSVSASVGVQVNVNVSLASVAKIVKVDSSEGRSGGSGITTKQ